MRHLFCFGLGYSARHVARQLVSEGWTVSGTSQTIEGAERIGEQGFEAFVFDGTSPGNGIDEALARSTHVIVSVPPRDGGDPVLRHHAQGIEFARSLQWIGYLSTVGVYGDRQGAWVDEESPPNPITERARRRVKAESAWLELGRRASKRVKIFRIAGIYGPGRSAIERLRKGTAQRIVKPGQVFNRIHVDDIVQVVAAAMTGRASHDIYNVTDDEPAPPQDVIAFGAELLGIPPPPEIPLEDADLSPMAASFYSDNKRVCNARLHHDLGVDLKFPNYREGLRAIADLEAVKPGVYEP